MNKRLFFVLLTLIVAASMFLSACGPAATEAPVVTEAPATEAVEEFAPEAEANKKAIETPTEVESEPIAEGIYYFIIKQMQLKIL